MEVFSFVTLHDIRPYPLKSKNNFLAFKLTMASGTVLDTKSYSPYELSASDNPGIAISPVQITGENYAEWASGLENALRAKRKSGFIDGTLPKPSKESGDLDAWNTVNSIVGLCIFMVWISELNPRKAKISWALLSREKCWGGIGLRSLKEINKVCCL